MNYEKGKTYIHPAMPESVHVSLSKHELFEQADIEAMNLRPGEEHGYLDKIFYKPGNSNIQKIKRFIFKKQIMAMVFWECVEVKERK